MHGLSFYNPVLGSIELHGKGDHFSINQTVSLSLSERVSRLVAALFNALRSLRNPKESWLHLKEEWQQCRKGIFHATLGPDYKVITGQLYQCDQVVDLLKKSQSKPKKLFEITTANLETGLRGVPVGYCKTSSVDPIKGLFYSGIPLSNLSDCQPEEVIYLLYFGKKGTAEEITQFSQNIKGRSICSQNVIENIRKLPRELSPMKMFTTAILLAGTFEGTGNYREDSLNLIAKIPQIAAEVINHHAGWGAGGSSNPELGYMENFVHMLKVPNKDKLVKAFKIFNILHYDHGGGNLSAFVGKAIASGLEDMYGSIAGAMCALAGPRHGKANQDCLNFMEGLLKELGDKVDEEAVEKLVRSKLSKNELLYGFGHAVLRVEDPRATLLYAIVEKEFPNEKLGQLAIALRKVGPKILSGNPKISNPYPNVDGISGTFLSLCGFPYSEYFPILFGVSRIVGIVRQIVYEREEARGGKGTPLVRPKYLES